MRYQQAFLRRERNATTEASLGGDIDLGDRGFVRLPIRRSAVLPALFLQFLVVV